MPIILSVVHICHLSIIALLGCLITNIAMAQAQPITNKPSDHTTAQNPSASAETPPASPLVTFPSLAVRT